MLLILNKKPNSTLTKPLMLIILNPTPTQPQPNPTPTQPLHHHVAGSSSSTRRLPLAAAKAQSFSSSPLPHSGVMSSVDRISLPQSWALEIGDSQKEKGWKLYSETDGFPSTVNSNGKVSSGWWIIKSLPWKNGWNSSNIHAKMVVWVPGDRDREFSSWTHGRSMHHYFKNNLQL